MGHFSRMNQGTNTAYLYIYTIVMRNFVFLSLSLLVCYSQAIPQQYADESLQDLYSSSDPYSQDPYYSSEELSAEHRQSFEEEVIPRKSWKYFRKNMVRYEQFFLVKT